MKKHKVFFMPHPPILIQSIGEGKERAATETLIGMQKVAQKIKEDKPDTIIFITPHGNSFSNGLCILYEDILTGHLGSFGHPEISYHKKVDKTLSKTIYDKLEEADITSVLMDKVTGRQYDVRVGLDHGVIVPMSFVDQEYSDYKIVHLTPGFTPLHEQYQIGKILNEIIEISEEKIAIICSGDLSHALSDQGPYEYNPSGPIFDEIVKNSIENEDPLALIFMDHDKIEAASQCGLRSFLIGFGSMDGYYYTSEVISYEGPFGVGYLTGFLDKKTEKTDSILKLIEEKKKASYEKRINREDDYIKLARKTIEYFIKTGKRLSLEQVKEQCSRGFIDHCLSHKSGAFVSIHKYGKLRGCIGTISAASDHLIDELIYNSISACSNDPRFEPVKEDELMDLEIKVDILYEKELISSKTKLDVHKYGVIVDKNGHRGLLLPNLDGIDNIDQQISIAMQKAGIDNEEGMKLYRFEVERHEIKDNNH